MNDIKRGITSRKALKVKLEKYLSEIWYIQLVPLGTVPKDFIFYLA